MPEPGALVVITGIDGSGKSTQSTLLRDHLKAAGLNVETGSWRLREVGSQFIGDLVRRVSKADLDLDPRTATLLFAANLSHRVETQVTPSLAAGHVLVEDDYLYKMAARACAHGLGDDWVESVFRFAPQPNLVIVLDVEPDVALARLGRPVTTYESGLTTGDRNGGFLIHQHAVRERLLQWATQHGFHVIQEKGRSIEDIQGDIAAMVDEMVGAPAVRPA